MSRTAALFFLATAAFAVDPSHEHPAPSLARSVDERQKTLAEMWQRRVIGPESESWNAQDLELLSRLRAVEAAGALSYLRAHGKSLKGALAVEVRVGGMTQTRLTKEGFDAYLFLKSQEALRYFDQKGIEMKWAFRLRDLDGRALFSENGLLTPAGDELYSRAAANRPAFWRSPTGEVRGNRRPPAH